jgi:hypothetical protein
MGISRDTGGGSRVKKDCWNGNGCKGQLRTVEPVSGDGCYTIPSAARNLSAATIEEKRDSSSLRSPQWRLKTPIGMAA